LSCHAGQNGTAGNERTSGGTGRNQTNPYYYDYAGLCGGTITKSVGGRIAETEFMNEPTYAAMGGAPKGYNAADYDRDIVVFGPWLKQNSPGKTVTWIARVVSWPLFTASAHASRSDRAIRTRPQTVYSHNEWNPCGRRAARSQSVPRECNQGSRIPAGPHCDGQRTKDRIRSCPLKRSFLRYVARYGTYSGEASGRWCAIGKWEKDTHETEVNSHFTNARRHNGVAGIYNPRTQEQDQSC
jgi:hypothetical protein